ncbi:MAG: TlpA family protein disulfide reductase [Candidatus Kariarchaeaceae archaeon]|jgi:thiol-disulfide isomerase/thioredoxin
MKKWLALILLMFHPIIAVMGYPIEGSFTTVTGQNVSFSAYEGNPILIDAFTTYCKPCETEILHIAEVHNSLAEKLEILSLSVDPSVDSIKKVQIFKEKFSGNEIDWTFGIDQNRDFIDGHSIDYIPSLFLFDHYGKLIKKWQGVTPAEDIINGINENLDWNVTFTGSSESEILLDQLLDTVPFQIFLSLLVLSISYKILVPTKVK